MTHSSEQYSKSVKEKVVSRHNRKITLMVRYFGQARIAADGLGHESVSLSIDRPTLPDVLSLVESLHPQLCAIMRISRVAINCSIPQQQQSLSKRKVSNGGTAQVGAENAIFLRDGDEIAILPPVTGG